MQLDSTVANDPWWCCRQLAASGLYQPVSSPPSLASDSPFFLVHQIVAVAAVVVVVVALYMCTHVWIVCWVAAGSTVWSTALQRALAMHATVAARQSQCYVEQVPPRAVLSLQSFLQSLLSEEKKASSLQRPLCFLPLT